jgi:hypothetical protein
MISTAQKVHDGKKGAAATIQCERVLSILKGSKISLKSESGWVSTSGIIEADWLARVWLSKGRREIDSRGYTTELRIWLVTAMNRSGSETTK